MPMIRDEPVVTTLLALILYASFHIMDICNTSRGSSDGAISDKSTFKMEIYTGGGGGGGRRTIYVPIST